MAELPAVPIRSQVVEPTTGWLHRDMVNFLNVLRGRLGISSSVVGSVEIEDVTAAVVTTDIPLPSLEAGVYRVSYNLRVSRAATTSSSVGITLGWTAGGVSCSQVFTMVTGNTTASQTCDDITMTIDAATPITYAVSYASVGATSMTYDLTLTVEVLP